MVCVDTMPHVSFQTMAETCAKGSQKLMCGMCSNSIWPFMACKASLNLCSRFFFNLSPIHSRWYFFFFPVSEFNSLKVAFHSSVNAFVCFCFYELYNAGVHINRPLGLKGWPCQCCKTSKIQSTVELKLFCQTERRQHSHSKRISPQSDYLLELAAFCFVQS